MPTNYSEDEVVEIINRIANGLCKEFKFGYYTLDDIKQQARLFALEGLKGYDENRPLENFLWVHVRNRLINFKRDEYERCESPCGKCKQRVIRNCSLEDAPYCSIYKKWIERNSTKKNLMAPVTILNVKDEDEDSMKTFNYAEDETSHNEVQKIIDKYLPVSLRKKYLQMIQGANVGRSNAILIRKTVREILDKHRYEYTG